jgi:hypothetical protein
MEPTFDKIKALYAKKGYFWSDIINIFGIRKVNGKVNEYDDLIGVCFNNGTGWDFFCFIATTEPGLDYLIDPMNPAGTSVVALGQHKNVWALGLHQNRKDRPSLVQVGTFEIYRDNNKDAVIDLINPQFATGKGINLHWSFAPKGTKRVGKSSAGCQVVLNEAAMERILDFARRSGNKTFTYTLFSSDEVA